MFVTCRLRKSGLAIAIMLLLVGCKSNSPSHYVSPRVIGRVLDQQTRQPLAGVQVKRVVPDYEAGTLDPVRGGEGLQQTQPLHTAADGTFDLDSKKSLALFRDIGWFDVEISFVHRGYEHFVTNYPPRMATTSSKGEPVIQAGDILLTPR
jgi:hypothetical protein